MGVLSESDRSVPHLIVCSRARAIRILTGAEDGPRIDTMISIIDPGQPLPAGHEVPKRLLSLEFYDTVVPSDPFGPTEADVESVLAFAPTVKEIGGTCLVHCQAGISRSTATGVLLVASWLGPGHEQQSAETILRLVPHAMPNPLLIAYGDSALGCRGALQRAVNDTFETLSVFS